MSLRCAAGFRVENDQDESASPLSLASLPSGMPLEHRSGQAPAPPVASRAAMPSALGSVTAALRWRCGSAVTEASTEERGHLEAVELRCSGETVGESDVFDWPALADDEHLCAQPWACAPLSALAGFGDDGWGVLERYLAAEHRYEKDKLAAGCRDSWWDWAGAMAATAFAHAGSSCCGSGAAGTPPDAAILAHRAAQLRRAQVDAIRHCAPSLETAAAAVNLLDRAMPRLIITATAASDASAAGRMARLMEVGMPAVAIAALWVASKVHERSPGELDVWVSEWPAPPTSAPDAQAPDGPDAVGSLSPALVMAVEAVLLDTLGWELVPVTPYHFAVAFIQAYAVQCEGVRRLAMQLCDTVMSAASVMGSRAPSAVGLGCLVAAMRIRQYQPDELTAKDAVHASAWQRWLLQSARWEGAGALEPVVASALAVSEWLLAGDGYRASPTTTRADYTEVASPIAYAQWTLRATDADISAPSCISPLSVTGTSAPSCASPARWVASPPQSTASADRAQVDHLTHAQRGQCAQGCCQTRRCVSAARCCRAQRSCPRPITRSMRRPMK